VRPVPGARSRWRLLAQRPWHRLLGTLPFRYVLDRTAMDEGAVPPVRVTSQPARSGPVRERVTRRERGVDLGVEGATGGEGALHHVLLQFAVVLPEDDEVVRE
jgi:hypothetical protein